MIGGYASADRWNAHYNEMEKRAGERARADITARAATIREEFPAGATWGAWYDWMKVNLPADHGAMYHYGCGHAVEASRTFEHFVAIAGKAS